MNDKNQDIVTNRKAFHDYEVLDTFEAGIVLQGTEIKSLRCHDCSLQEAYIKVLDRELWIIGSYIAPYKFGNIYNHEEKRDRKLLMHRREIERLQQAIQEKGLAIIPLAIYLKKGRAKLKIGICRGKKQHDKRASTKEREEKRNMQRAMKHDA